MVVNLYYTDPKILSVHGFGYLIPKSVPWEQNPEQALGVIFDSDALKGQDTVPGTKLTVMLGGHWWDDVVSYPDEEEGLAMAKSILRRHLGITAQPAASKVGLHKNCIPQYTVGHDARMKQGHFELMKAFKGQLAVAGNSYAGVSVGDCVRSARDVAKSFVDGELVTGLEQFLTPKEYSPVKFMAPPPKQKGGVP
jgi:oxygen-dependent protoporphyrinogen oxidase